MKNLTFQRKKLCAWIQSLFSNMMNDIKSNIVCNEFIIIAFDKKIAEDKSDSGSLLTCWTQESAWLLWGRKQPFSRSIKCWMPFHELEKIKPGILAEDYANSTPRRQKLLGRRRNLSSEHFGPNLGNGLIIF